MLELKVFYWIPQQNKLILRFNLKIKKNKTKTVLIQIIFLGKFPCNLHFSQQIWSLINNNKIFHKYYKHVLIGMMMRVILMIIMDKAVKQVARVSRRNVYQLLMQIKILQINHKQYWFKPIKRTQALNIKNFLILSPKINKLYWKVTKTLIKIKTQNNLKDVKQTTKSTFLIKITLSKAIKSKKIIK
jgi:hypothetical protein